jgi:hypothetical protein
VLTAVGLWATNVVIGGVISYLFGVGLTTV